MAYTTKELDEQVLGFLEKRNQRRMGGTPILSLIDKLRQAKLKAPKIPKPPRVM